MLQFHQSDAEKRHHGSLSAEEKLQLERTASKELTRLWYALAPRRTARPEQAATEQFSIAHCQSKASRPPTRTWKPPANRLPSFEIPPSIRDRIEIAFAEHTMLRSGPVAKLLSVDAKTLRALCDQGHISYVVIGSTHRQFAKEQVTEFVEKVFACPSIDRNAKTARFGAHTSYLTSKLRFQAKQNPAVSTAPRVRKRVLRPGIMRTNFES